MLLFIKKIVSEINYSYKNKFYFFFNIVESFKLLYEGKKDFYLKTNKNMPPELEEIKINNVVKYYHLDGLYYGLDHHNIFKRADRYKNKIVLIIMFGILVIFNLFEIIFYTIMLAFMKKKTGDFEDTDRLITAIISLINVFVTFILSSITITKRKIQSYVFY